MKCPDKALSASLTLLLSVLPATAHEASQRPLQSCPNLALSNTVLADNLQEVEHVFRRLPEASRRNLQHLLRHAGFYEGADDGSWGPRTKCALAAIVGRFPEPMSGRDLADLFDYLLAGGLAGEYPGTPHPVRHPGLLPN